VDELKFFFFVVWFQKQVM